MTQPDDTTELLEVEYAGSRTVVDATAELLDERSDRVEALEPDELWVDRRTGVTHLPIENLLDRPERRRGTVDLLERGSFVEYVQAFGVSDDTTIYVDRSQFVAVLNDHRTLEDEGGDFGDGPGQAGWGDYRATYRPAFDEDWQRWRQSDGKFFDQDEFAHWLQDSIDVVQAPDAADLLELAQHFEATTGAQFQSGQRLHSGARTFRYAETIEAKAGQEGQLEIPEELTLRLPIFEGEDPQTVPARFRFRIERGNLKLGYQIVRRSELEREAFTAIVDAVDQPEALGNYRVIRGTPPVGVARS